jgi:FKBP-type peptidyl-prolyl cis-trans isomerase
MADKIHAGDVVRIHYTGRLENGTVFSTSLGGEPLEFTAGGDEVIEGLSEAVIGMEPGQRKTITIPRKRPTVTAIPIWNGKSRWQTCPKACR